jgi:DNA polymerase I-like protein with 3'-5' exonuclease and polymerase domains
MNAQIPLFADLIVPKKTKHYTLLESSDTNYQKTVDTIFNSARIILDLETFNLDKYEGSLDPVEGRVRLVQVKSTEDETAYLIDLGGRWEDRKGIEIRHKYFLDSLTQYLNSDTKIVIGHNLSFDLRFLRYQYGIRTRCFAVDTMIGARVLFGDFGASTILKKDSVLPGGYGLKNLASKLLDLEVDKTDQEYDWGSVLGEQQLTYAALDVTITNKVYDTLVSIYTGKSKPSCVPSALVHPGILEAWKLENRVIVKALDVEAVGLPCDLELLDQKIEKLETLYRDLEFQWLQYCPLSPNQTTKLTSWLVDQGLLPKGSTKLDKGVIAGLAATHSELKILAQLRAIKSLLDNLHCFKTSTQYDGRVHTMYRTLSGVGRFSSGATKISAAYPNLQSISAKSNPVLSEFNIASVRSVIKPLKGRVMAVIDLAGAHGRIAAGLANDVEAIKCENDPSIDGHLKVAEFVAKAKGLNLSFEELTAIRKDKSHPSHKEIENIRSTAKNTRYGWLNGAGAKTIQAQITANTGTTPSLEDCEGALEGCRKLYSGIAGFVKNLLQRLSSYVFDIGGRKFCLHCPEGGHHLCYEMEEWQGELQPPYTKSIAATWQLIESVAVKEGFIAASELIEKHPDWNLVIINVVHDELDIECDEEYAEQAITAVNNAFNDAFLRHLSNGVVDGRETDWTKLKVNSWADK